MRIALSPIVLTLVVAGLAEPAQAQPLGSFTWQLQPFCNRVTVNVRQDGAVYTLDGFDDQCGAAHRAPLVGLATPNPDGTIGFGLNIVLPDGQSGSLEARITLAGLSGTWRDAAGNSGPFVFGGNVPGSLRPPSTPGSGDITGVTAGIGLTGGGASGDVALAVNPAVVQSRVTTSCPAGQALRSIAQNGTAVCEPVTGTAGGDITAVNPGLGLSGGGAAGDVTLDVVFGGPGVSSAAARSDHTHVLTVSGSTAVGLFALANNSNIGTNNTAVGGEALRQTTSGFANTAMGDGALRSNVTGTDNTAVGRKAAGLATGTANTALGSLTLRDTTTGQLNTAVGTQVLDKTTTGSNNTAVGVLAGTTNVTGSLNTFVGRAADVGSAALSNASAIGARARVDQSDAMVLGSIDGVNGAAADVDVGIGTTTPGARLDIASEDTGSDIRITVADGSPDLVGRASSGTRVAPAPVGLNGALLILRGQGYTGTDYEEGGAVVLRATEPWTTTAHGTKVEFQTTPNTTTNQSVSMVIDHDGEVGIGTATPLAPLHVAGLVRVDALGTVGATQLCRNGSNQIAICSSSLRYKQDVETFDGGLQLVRRLRPVSFTWKQQGTRDVGFAAEDVAAIDPRFAAFNDDGSVEGVKYDRLTAVLVNAIRELEDRNAALERRLAALEAARATK